MENALTNRKLLSPFINRRTALAGLTAFGAVPSFANPLSNIHIRVADQARTLAGGRALKMRLLVPKGTGSSVDLILAAFREASGITIEKVESAVDDINTDLALDHLSQAHQYDLALPSTFGVSDLAEAGVIMPVTDFANEHEPTGFRQGILYGSGDRFGDEIYGYQADGDAYLMFYNNLMLEDPRSQDEYAQHFGTQLLKPQTWEELDRQISFFNRPEQDQYGGLLFRIAGYVAWEWWVRFHAKGSWPFTEDMQPLIANDAGISALEDMLAISSALHPAVTHLDLFANWKTYSKGNVYANIGWGGSQKYFQRHAGRLRGNIAYGPTPGGLIDGKVLSTPYFNWGWTYVVTTSCKEPEIAYLFNLFASSPEISTLSVRQANGFFDPFRPEHYEDPGIQATYTQDFLNVHRQSLEHSIPDLYLHRQGDYFQSLGKWIYRALNREVSPKVALTSVAQKWDAITREAGHAGQVKDWANLKRVYPEHVRNVLRDTL